MNTDYTLLDVMLGCLIAIPFVTAYKTGLISRETLLKIVVKMNNLADKWEAGAK